MELSVDIKPHQGAGLSDKVLGMVFILATEAMFFAGLISAFVVNKAGNTWPPVNQPRLPIEMTAVNTVILLLSAVTLYLANRSASNGVTKKTISLLVATLLFGAMFLGIQGTEWIKLIGFGLTTSSSLFGAFFYTIIGIHGFHVLIGMLLLLYLFRLLRKPAQVSIQLDNLTFYGMYWYFVVGIWPILYYLVYLI